MALKGGSVDGPVPEWVAEAQELYEIVQATGWDEDTIDETPAVTLDALRQVAALNTTIERERLAQAIARAIHVHGR